MRSQTSETFVREFLDVQMRPKTAKLMTSTQLRNLSAKTSKPNFEITTKPQVEIQYQKFIQRNFGVLCDQYNRQFYNIEAIMKAINIYSCESLEDLKIMVQLKRPKSLQIKPEVYKLIEIDSRQRQDPETITEREKELKYKRQLLQRYTQNIQQRQSCYYCQIDVKSSSYSLTNDHQKEEGQEGTPPFDLKLKSNQKTAIGEGFDYYLIEKMTYQNKKIQLNVYSISGSKFIDEIQKPKDIEFVLEQRRFTCIMPKLIVYCDDINKNATIPLPNLKMSQLLQSNFQEIDNYMSEIDELSNFVIPQKMFPVSMQPAKFNQKRKNHQENRVP